jgi:selenobiotic family peptide radical SAM maturase
MLRDRWLWGRRARCFTLQWHITDACGLRCRHCYTDRRQPPAPLAQLRDVLRDLARFCRSRRVEGHVCLTGGDPFCHPDFFELYRDVADSGMRVSILGNPVPRDAITRLVAIRRPSYYQVSLEGLQQTNDHIRGEGHFASTIDFLRLLREHGICTSVMLTLSRDNIDEVLPLGELLRPFGVRFRFNRLVRVGRGQTMPDVSPSEYERFLRRYRAAAEENPVLQMKDGLFNILQWERGEAPLGGCTGYGCGAAFNFLALLPNGEAHACRKFPSPVGDVFRHGLAAAYDSEAARRYRQGSRGCRGCALRRSCGGCLAVTHGRGLDPLTDRDPYCFMPASGW